MSLGVEAGTASTGDVATGECGFAPGRFGRPGLAGVATGTAGAVLMGAEDGPTAATGLAVLVATGGGVAGGRSGLTNRLGGAFGGGVASA